MHFWRYCCCCCKVFIAHMQCGSGYELFLCCCCFLPLLLLLLLRLKIRKCILFYYKFIVVAVVAAFSIHIVAVCLLFDEISSSKYVLRYTNCYARLESEESVIVTPVSGSTDGQKPER